MSKELPFALRNGPILALHVVPLSAVADPMDLQFRYDDRTAWNRHGRRAAPAYCTSGKGAGGKTRAQTSRLADRIMNGASLPDRTAIRATQGGASPLLAARSRPVIPLGRERTAERGHRHPASLKAWRRALQLAPETFGRVRHNACVACVMLCAPKLLREQLT